VYGSVPSVTVVVSVTLTELVPDVGVAVTVTCGPAPGLGGKHLWPVMAKRAAVTAKAAQAL